MKREFWTKEDGIFYEDFSGGVIDYKNKWRRFDSNWGGTEENNGLVTCYNGGVVCENIHINSEGILVFEAHGNHYTGDVKGIYPPGLERKDNIRVGGVLRSMKAFCSGSYEMVVKPCPRIGTCTAFWTFQYNEDENGHAVNHEVDIEIPGRVTPETQKEAFSYCLCNNWTGLRDDEHICNRIYAGCQLDDGEFHHFRYDWHTGDKEKGIEPHTDFYIDGRHIHTETKYVPVNAGEFFIGVWLPNTWEGVPDFDTDVCEVKWIKITPFFESGDRCVQNEILNTGELE